MTQQTRSVARGKHGVEDLGEGARGLRASKRNGRLLRRPRHSEWSFAYFLLTISLPLSTLQCLELG